MEMAALSEMVAFVILLESVSAMEETANDLQRLSMPINGSALLLSQLFLPKSFCQSHSRA